MKKKSIVIAAVSAVLLVAAVIGSIFLIKNIQAARLEKEMREKPIKVAFYNVESKTQEAVVQLFKAEWEKLSPDFTYELVFLSGNKSIDDHLFEDSSIVLLFSDAGTAESVADRAVVPESSVYSVMPTSVKNVSSTSVPLLLDSLEVLYNRKALNASGTETSPLMADMLSFAKDAAGNRRYAMGIPAKDDRTLGMFVSAVMESLYSEKALESLKTVISRAEMADRFGDIFENVLEAEGNGYFQQALEYICGWRNQGLLHTEWHSMTLQEVEYLMDTELFPVVFIPLSLHRNLSYRTVEKYEEMFFPAGRIENSGVHRSLVYTVYTGTVLKNRYEEKSSICMEILSQMVNSENQTLLSEKTGLAPANASTETADRQASNARLWAAAASKPVAGLYECFSKPEARSAFFEGLRTYLKMN